MAKCSQNAGIGIIATNTTMFVVFKRESGVDILSNFQSKCFIPKQIIQFILIGTNSNSIYQANKSVNGLHQLDDVVHDV